MSGLSGAEITDRRRKFADLHTKGRPFVLANAWDVGSARLAAGLGAEALATTSSGWAFTLGLSDASGRRQVDRDAAIEHAAALNEATNLPVSADLENGYGDAPEAVAETVAAASMAGLAGVSIEDVRPADAGSDGGAYDAHDAVERIAAAVEAARVPRGSGDVGVVLTARADGVMTGAYDLEEAIRRLKAFAEAGADVVYCPMPGDIDALRRIVDATQKPVNALAAGPFASVSLEDFAAVGVARVSLGSTLARMSQGAVLDGLKRVLNSGAIDPERRAAASGEVDALLEKGAQKGSSGGDPS